MTTISSVNATNSTTGVNYAGALTPDALMVYCSSRLGDIDGQLQLQAQKQEQSRDVSSAINALQTRFSSCRMEKGVHTVTTEEETATNAEFDAAIGKLPPGSNERTTLEELKSTFGATMNDRKISQDECTKWAQGLGDVTKNVGSSAELDMIKMQSLMSQRQTAVQICTSMVSSLGDTTKSIAQKIA